MKLKVIDAVRFQLPLFRLVTWADLDRQGTYREVVCELLPLCAMCYYPSPPLLLLLARIHIIWCPLCPTRLTTSPQSPSVFWRKKSQTKLLRTCDIHNILLATPKDFQHLPFEVLIGKCWWLMDFIMMGRFQMRSSSTPWKPQWTSLVPRDPQIAGNSPTTVSCCRPISTPWALVDHPSHFSQGGTCSKNFRELPLDIFYSQGSEGGASHLRSLIWNLRQFNISISSRSRNLFSGNFPLHPHLS